MTPDRRTTEEPSPRPDLRQETIPKGTPPPPEAPAAIATMWYWLGSVGVLVLVLLFALFYWDRDPREGELTEPTTGISDQDRQEGKPGGINPDPRFDSPDEEIKNRTR